MTRFAGRAGAAPGKEPSAKGHHAHIDARQLPALRPVEEIGVGRPHDLYTGRVDEPTIKDVAGQGYVVVPPDRPPRHSRIGSQPDFGLTQCHIILLYGRNGASRHDKNTGYRRVLIVGVPAHDDVVDSPDRHTRRIADGPAKNMGERDYPVSEGPAESELLT